MTWIVALHAALLIASSGLAVWAGVAGRRHRTVPGSVAFAWLMFATAHWAVLSALHAVVEDYEIRIVLSQLQYLGIASVAPLWLTFASQYARSRWLHDRTLVALLWIVPLATVIIAFTNPWHRLLWIEVRPAPGDRLEYVHGPWFWLEVIYSYAAVGIGTVLLVRALRRFPLPYRRQTLMIIAAVLAPWAGNAVYVSGWLPRGFDITPIAFALSGMLFAWAFYRHRLFSLVPIARDLVIDSITDGVIVLDQQRAIVDFNPAAHRLTGCSADCIGRPIGEAVPWGAAAIEHTAPNGDPHVITAGERTMEVELKTVLDGQNRDAGWLVLVRDITARRKVEHERRLLERRMLEQQKLESLSVLAGGVAHEFNNLLTGILGNADLLAMNTTTDPSLRKSADAIVIGAERAADLVAKMLAYAGQGRVISEPIDLDELLRDLLDLLRASVARHCTLEFVTDGHLPRVRADPTQVRQLVLNLIVNASEAVDDDGRVIVATGAESLTPVALGGMTFAEATPGRFVYIAVQDDGPGIDAATQARMFDPFFSTRQTGRGLGLAAVQGIVRSHKGALRVWSAPESGTTFRVWLPLDQ